MPLLLALLVLVLIVAAGLILRQQNLRLRQMQHRERLAAIEKGLMPGQTPPREGDDMSEPLTSDPRSYDPATKWKDPSTYINWLRISTLGLAFLLMFGGAGMLVAFIIIPDPEMQKVWPIGLIPMMAGFGLFLFAILSSKLVGAKDD